LFPHKSLKLQRSVEKHYANACHILELAEKVQQVQQSSTRLFVVAARLFVFVIFVSHIVQISYYKPASAQVAMLNPQCPPGKQITAITRK
ncbi:hypothetical protein T4A_8731, partial [Trichinella pseudospiralis]